MRKHEKCSFWLKTKKILKITLSMKAFLSWIAGVDVCIKLSSSSVDDEFVVVVGSSDGVAKRIVVADIKLFDADDVNDRDDDNNADDDDCSWAEPLLLLTL